VLAVRADVTDGDATKQAMAEIADKLGGFDVLFANAGIDKESPLGETTLADFEEIVRTNLTAVFFTIQAALPHLKDGASIILSGSVQAVLGIPRRSADAATKGGVRAMGRNLASELAPRRIRVNQVTPGATRTPLWSPFAPTEDAMSALEQQTAGAVPLGRMGDAEEVAKAALYLASDDASYMTGAEIVLDGGATSRGIQGLGVAADDRDPCALGGEKARRRETDAAVAACNHRHLVGKPHGSTPVRIG
jgi:NAD(P)-dependent dehydrogenase (short-subunit alcohol dehydrogenase family)